MKKIVLLVMFLLLFFSQSAYGAMTYGGDNYILNRRFALSRDTALDPIYRSINEIETIIEAMTLENGDTITFSTYGGTFGQSANNVFKWTETPSALEDILLTFSANAVTWSSTTDVVTMGFGAVVPTANQFLFTPVTDPTGTVEGTVYYDSDTDKLYVRNSSSWVDLTTAGTGTPAGSDTQMQYNNAGAWGAISTIIWDDTNLEFQDDQSIAFGTDGDWVINFDASVDSQLLFLTAGTSAGDVADPMFEIIVGASPTANQQVFGVAKGTQSSNTALFTVDEDGDVVITNDSSVGGNLAVTGTLTAGAFVSDITLSGGETITNTVDSEIRFRENTGGEDLILDMDAGSNAIGLKSGTGVDELAMGAVDDLTGVGTIVFDAVASSITLTADSANDDLTISQAGSQDASIHITSAGTGADAITISTSAGGMDLTVAGAAAAEDLDISSNTAVNISSSEAADLAINISTSNAAGQIQITSADTSADGIEIDSAGGIDVDAVDDVAIDISGAGKNFDVDSAAGSIYLDAGEADAAAVTIIASNAAGGIDIDAGTGGIAIDVTGAADIRLDSSAGSVYIEGAEAIADAIDLYASAGGIDIRSATTYDIDVTATGGTVQVIASEAAANQFKVDAQGVIAGNAIVLETTDGGLQINVDGEANGDIDIDCDDELRIDVNDVTISTDNVIADQFKVDAKGVYAGYVINLETTDGGILLNADGDANGDIEINAADDGLITVAGDLTVNVTGTTSFSDKSITQVGDISCDDIVSDADSDVMYMLKTVIKTIDVDDDASTDDFQFDDDQANQTEQSVDLGAIIPAYAEVVSAQLRCFETVTGSAVMAIDLGVTTGAGDILATSNCDTANDIKAVTVAGSPIVAALNTAQNVWINATPGVDWNTLDAGRWAVMVTYIDYGACYTQKNP